MSILEWENVIQQQVYPIKIITTYTKSISVNNNYIYIIKSSRNDINIIKLSNGRIFLEFIKEEWKYSNFINCQIIYLEIGKKIYKLCPNMVKSNMIDVDIPVKKKVFINNLINGKLDNSLSLPNQCNLYIKQQGAGNGKTFGIIQRLVSKEFSHYESIIIVTKQHSAKYVIYNELQSQIEKKQLNINILNRYENKKKYIIEFKNNDNINCKLVIATVDSFIWTMGDKNNKGYDIFITKLYSIINDNLPQNCTYVGDIELNKKLCLVCDETQDLSILYAKALIRIMRNKYIDLYVVGDKLQSLQFIDNAFIYLYDNEFPYITKYKETPVNICRRFNSLDLINFVNNAIPFERYNLPKIQIDNNGSKSDGERCNSSCKIYKSINDNSNDENDNNNIKIFYGESIYNNDFKANINKEIDEIMKKYIYEVENYNYKPNDFLIITPFTNKNILMNTLEIAINMFWVEKYDDKNKYKRYAIFHKSEVGNSINLDESINTTRMVSIHSSKGDGRNVVFLIGFTENALNKFSGESNNLIYDSLIHVAFTRMKKRMYIRLEKNKFDRFYTLIGKNSNLPYQRIEHLDISKYINIKNIKSYVQNQVTYELLYDIINFESNKLSDINSI